MKLVQSMQGNAVQQQSSSAPKQASGVVKYQCFRTTITNYMVGCSAGGTEALPCVRNRNPSLQKCLNSQSGTFMLFPYKQQNTPSKEYF